VSAKGEYQVSRNEGLEKDSKTTENQKKFIKIRRKIFNSRKLYQGQEKDVIKFFFHQNQENTTRVQFKGFG
jgi:hypothetical protein